MARTEITGYSDLKISYNGIDIVISSTNGDIVTTKTVNEFIKAM